MINRYKFTANPNDTTRIALLPLKRQSPCWPLASMWWRLRTPWKRAESLTARPATPTRSWSST